MKYTNIKKLLIKFMGGGLINFPTRFLRWVKIDGDTEGDNSGSGGSTEIDYEAVYQFYKKIVTENILTPQYLESTIIPEHFDDIKDGTGPFEEYENKTGIWKGNPGENGLLLFNDFSAFPANSAIYLGEYNYQYSGPNV